MKSRLETLLRIIRLEKEIEKLEKSLSPLPSIKEIFQEARAAKTKKKSHPAKDPTI